MFNAAFLIFQIFTWFHFRRRSAHKEPIPEPLKPMTDATPFPTDPVELRRMQYQTPGN